MTDSRVGRAERVGATAAVATAVLVTGAGLGVLVAGSNDGWLVLAIGWGVLVPLAAGSGVLVVDTIRAGFDAAATITSNREGRTEIAVGDLADEGDFDRSHAREQD